MALTAALALPASGCTDDGAAETPTPDAAPMADAAPVPRVQVLASAHDTLRVTGADDQVLAEVDVVDDADSVALEIPAGGRLIVSRPGKAASVAVFTELPDGALIDVRAVPITEAPGAPEQSLQVGAFGGDDARYKFVACGQAHAADTPSVSFAGTACPSRYQALLLAQAPSEPEGEPVSLGYAWARQVDRDAGTHDFTSLIWKASQPVAVDVLNARAGIASVIAAIEIDDRLVIIDRLPRPSGLGNVVYLPDEAGQRAMVLVEDHDVRVLQPVLTDGPISDLSVDLASNLPELEAPRLDGDVVRWGGAMGEADLVIVTQGNQRLIAPAGRRELRLPAGWGDGGSTEMGIAAIDWSDVDGYTEALASPLYTRDPQLRLAPVGYRARTRAVSTR